MFREMFTHQSGLMRPCQEEAFTWLEEKINEGYTDLVLEAPTGAGKSAIGTTVMVAKTSGYYCVTQKGLQDQLITDVEQGQLKLDLKDLRSCLNYECPDFKFCRSGPLANTCLHRTSGRCPYLIKKKEWKNAKHRLTNYAYLLTEHIGESKLEALQTFILDESHNLEQELVRLMTLELNNAFLERLLLNTHLPTLGFQSKEQAFTWLSEKLLLEILDEIDVYEAQLDLGETLTKREAGRLSELDSLAGRIYQVFTFYEETGPDNWLVYEEKNDLLTNLAPKMIFKPIEINGVASDFFKAKGLVRVYLSAFIGDRDEFCKALGLNLETTAWLSLPSEFPVDNRPVYVASVGSMGQKRQQETLPKMIKALASLIHHHDGEKGLLHCHSYSLGKKIYELLRQYDEDAASRIIFQSKPDQRQELVDRHKKAKSDTILMSPSITEGYDFKDDLATWQALLKMPFPHLLDPWINAKKQLSSIWYTQETLKTVVQAAGRICRHDKDFGITYILDSDFTFIFNQYHRLLPQWFKDALRQF